MLSIALEGMIMTKRLCFLAVLLSFSLAFAQTAKKAPAPAPAGPDPWVGNWKLDTATSKFHGPAPKEETLTIDAANRSAVKYSTKGTQADGKPYTESYDGKPDGKEYSLLRDGQPVARISYHRNTDHNSTGHGATADGATFVETVTLSNDGKTITVKQHFTAKEGEFDNVVVFHKV
jgi:hypothetical protein